MLRSKQRVVTSRSFDLLTVRLSHLHQAVQSLANLPLCNSLSMESFIHLFIRAFIHSLTHPFTFLSIH
ncbi:hypothetical protein EGR_03202 [Echinococcus granulosus]|uniref:Uncharacterized protein n=1 Tax=Echinococcus granulosus TaxID=6210 RepID=W6V688_ECHGR|nr:hypothetical protein EGR_03202 [Echinococcus granulosus]EUB61929.1 hypothetical protein EGR_03202 [Echinococcus granulosus]